MALKTHYIWLTTLSSFEPIPSVKKIGSCNDSFIIPTTILMRNTAPIVDQRKQGKLPRGVIDIPLVHKLYETYREWHRLQGKFPKAERYSLGGKVAQSLLDVLEMTLRAASAPELETKVSSVTQASGRLDTTKLLVRLCKDCQCLDNNAYQNIESRLYEIGKMFGGWLKSMQEKKG